MSPRARQHAPRGTHCPSRTVPEEMQSACVRRFVCLCACVCVLACVSVLGCVCACVRAHTCLLEPQARWNKAENALGQGRGGLCIFGQRTHTYTSPHINTHTHTHTHTHTNIGTDLQPGRHMDHVGGCERAAGGGYHNGVGWPELWEGRKGDGGKLGFLIMGFPGTGICAF